MTLYQRILLPIFALWFLLLSVHVLSADITRFEGTFAGATEFQSNGKTVKRDLSTTIEKSRSGFEVSWTSVTYRRDGSSKAKSYTIDFVPSERENIYGSAMKTNLFGKAVPLDPLQGDPFVWARLEGDTLTVYSLFIDELGDYDMQEFHRTLVDEGLDLVFRRFSNGQLEREIKALLVRQN